jgi:hypothetical protein
MRLARNAPNRAIAPSRPRSPSWVLVGSVAGASSSSLSMVAIVRVIGPHATGY